MATPPVTDYRLKRNGHNDPSGNTDYWNRYCKMLWGNFSAYNTEYGAGTGEHDRDGDHMADMLAIFHNFQVGSYTGNGADDRNISLTYTAPVYFVRIWEASTAGTYFRSSSWSSDATFRSYYMDAPNDYIQSVATDGQFQVGTQLNVNGRVYYYIAYMGYEDSGGT